MPFWSKPTGREARACLDLEDPADPGEVPADPAAAPEDLTAAPAALEDPDTVRPRPASFTARPSAPARTLRAALPRRLYARLPGAPGCAGAVVGLPALLTAVL